MDALDVKPPEDLMAFKSGKLRAMFKENIDDVGLDNANLPESIQKLFNNKSHDAPKTGQDHQNELALKAQIGDSSADLTSAGQERKRKEAAEHQGKNNALRTIASNPINNSISSNKYLIGVKLNDEHMIDINDDKILMVRGDGPDSELREMRIGEKDQIEDTSKMNSIYVTQDEVEMNAYLRGDTDIIPEALSDLAEENGRLATDVSRDEFRGMVTEKYPINISLRVNSDMPLKSGGLTLDDVGLAMPPISPEITPAPDAPAPVLAQTPMM